ncbi:carboxylating nicotinate-nucleotide diphosphorylase [bacterium]|nr:carboxylating nicotinate-nucleotide diphosphorylase [bacterium]MBU1153529.1 carboxylating nicotinate-nucleotide diphosphorylase [bacterium]MBU1782387.1 carboxylating nicotinate-nucleotide diphosphorylase [bacterium]
MNLNKVYFKSLIKKELLSDLGKGDLTTELVVPKEIKVRAEIIAKEEQVIAGLEVIKIGFKLLDPKIKVELLILEGKRVKKGEKIAEIAGKASQILKGERTILNFLQRMSGIATLTSNFVRMIEKTKCKILDTRKTTPGLRRLEKYAVKTGGGNNHRFGLYDQVLIKDNHLKIVPKIREAIKRVNSKTSLKVEVEISKMRELKEVLKEKVDMIMLDNMSISRLKKAVDLIKEKDQKIKIEVSGNVTLKKIEKIAQLGVDFISIGALTHSFKSTDLSLEIKEVIK